jgi:glycosyltransferase involved in cell wall biosynthesis
MRSLIITALYPPAVGGAATYFSDIAPELARRDDIEELVVLTERMPGQPRQRANGKLRLLRYLPTRVSLPQRRWLTHAVTYALTQLWFAARLPGLVQQHRVGLIHFHTRFRGRLLYTALRRSGVPVLADLRDKMTDPARLVGVADWLLCCGEGVQRFAIEGGVPAERTVLIPIPFTMPEIPSPKVVSDVRRRYELGDGPYLLFVGDVTYNKGVYDLLETYRRWRAEHPQVRLVFAGTNREGERFLKQVQQAVGAIYLDYVPHRDALALMRGAEVVVLPSRSEGLPIVILEAMALGARVICPPGIPEFERHLPQFVLPSVDADSIVKTLNVVWHDNTLPSYPLSEHSVHRVVEGLADVYSEVVKGKVG